MPVKSRGMFSKIAGVGALLVAAGGGMAATLGDYTIVRPATMSAADETVLEDVRSLLEKAVGVRLKTVTPETAPDRNRIYFGLAPADADVRALSAQEFVTAVDAGGDIRLYGGGTNGTANAAYDYLQTTLGFRFFDSRGGMRVPDLRAYEPKPMARRRRMSFEHRGLSMSWHFNGPEWARFALRHGINRGIRVVAEREKIGTATDEVLLPQPRDASLVRYLPRNRKAPHAISWANDLIGEDLEKTHPEYFTMNKDGARVFNHQRCLSDPGCRALLKKIVFEQFRRNPDPRSYIDISAGDTPGRFCECPGCVALMEKYGSNAGPLVDVFLEFCPVAAKLYPHHRFMTLAYRKAQTQHPPKNLAAMPDNFVPDFAPIDDDFAQDWAHPNNRETYEDLKTWGRLCKRVMMWYYPNPYGNELTPPLGNVGRLVNDIRLMHAAGVTETGFEHNVGVETMTGFTELQTYLTVNLFRDIDADDRKLTDEFLDFEYGKAAPGVKAYLAKLEGLRKDMTTPIPWNGASYLGNFTYLTPERLVRWCAAFDRLEHLTADDRRACRNVRRLRLGLDFVVLKKHAEIVRSCPDWKTSAAEALARIRAEIAEIGEDCYDAAHQGKFKAFVKNVDDQLFLLDLQNRTDAKPLPKDLFGAVPKDRLVVAMANNSDGGKVEDPDAAYGIAFAFVGRSRPEYMKLPLVGNVETINPTVTWQPNIGPGVTRGNLGEKGRYKFYYMGEATIMPNCYVEFGCYNFRAYLNAAYEEGSFNRVRIYASFKFEGPAFYAGDTRPNRILCDRVVVVKK